MNAQKKTAAKGERIAKVMARAGLCSRRDAEVWIENRRVSLNGTLLTSAAINVGPKDVILVDGNPLPEKQLTRVWLYYKPKGLMTTAYDPEGRATVFDNLPADMPRVISIGRLDLNSEGLLLLTNDGELARKLELPATAWIRRYRVRVNGRIDAKMLESLKQGIEIENVKYQGIDAALERQQGANAWLTMALTEGKNREIRRICQHFGWPVSRLIRVAYGPFLLGEMEPGQVAEVKGKLLQNQLRFGNDWRPQSVPTDDVSMDSLGHRDAHKTERTSRVERPTKRKESPRRSERPHETKIFNTKHDPQNDRRDAGDEPSRRSGFKAGWAKNKPKKAQPGSHHSLKRHHRAAEEEVFPIERDHRDRKSPNKKIRQKSDDGSSRNKPVSSHARRFR